MKKRRGHCVNPLPPIHSNWSLFCLHPLRLFNHELTQHHTTLSPFRSFSIKTSPLLPSSHHSSDFSLSRATPFFTVFICFVHITTRQHFTIRSCQPSIYSPAKHHCRQFTIHLAELILPPSLPSLHRVALLKPSPCPFFTFRTVFTGNHREYA